MAVKINMKHLDKVNINGLRFRRRIPVDVAESFSKDYFEVHLKNTKGQAFQHEYAALLSEFDRVAEARQRLSGNDLRSPAERWDAA